jgi:hypothetical protein
VRGAREQNWPTTKFPQAAYCRLGAFCARFSPDTPSSDINNFFPRFAERFFECVTGLSVEDKGCGIDRQVRAAIRRLPIETERAKLLSALSG